MSMNDQPIDIPVDGQHIAGTLVSPGTARPGFLFVHGWRGSQRQYLARAREIAALGCFCLTFDLRGHERTDDMYDRVNREQNLHDVLAAYDVLAGHRGVDPDAVAVVGSSYGGYLAAIVTTLRPVRWLALRAPALYKDEDWGVPKHNLDRDALATYRRGAIAPADNRALRACAGFTGDVLVVESERDDVVPHPVIANYRAAFGNAHSLTYRIIADADHGISDQRWQEAYTSILVNWAAEMVPGAREDGGAPGVHTHIKHMPQRPPPHDA